MLTYATAAQLAAELEYRQGTAPPSRIWDRRGRPTAPQLRYVAVRTGLHASDGLDCPAAIVVSRVDDGHPLLVLTDAESVDDIVDRVGVDYDVPPITWASPVDYRGHTYQIGRMDCGTSQYCDEAYYYLVDGVDTDDPASTPWLARVYATDWIDNLISA